MHTCGAARAWGVRPSAPRQRGVARGAPHQLAGREAWRGGVRLAVDRARIHVEEVDGGGESVHAPRQRARRVT